MGIKEMFQNRVSAWVRYSEYVIIDTDKGYMVTPAPDAEMSIYDPINCIEDIISDAINWGQELYNNQNDDVANEIALKFTNKYGLLGLMTAIPANKFFDISDEEVYVGFASEMLGSETLMDTKDYIAFFTNDASTQEDTRVAHSIGRTRIYDIVFSRNYYEPAVWVASTLTNLFLKFYSIKKINTAGTTVEQNMAFETYIYIFDGQGLFFTTKVLPTPKIYWQFDSLKSEIETAFGIYISEENSPLKICKLCHKAYYNTDKRSEFCSPQCRNKWNVYKSRAKKKES